MTHVREHHSVLAAAEKRLLIRIAGHLPPLINSDHLSALALGCMLLAGVGFAVMRVSPTGAWIVVGALAGNWFGDSLDGTVARVRGHQRPRYGFYVDHILDLAGAVFLLGGLALSGLVAPALAGALLVAYLLVCAETYLATAVSSVFRLSFLGFGPTELRILLAVGAIKASANPWVDLVVLGRVRLFDVGAAIGTAGLLTAFVVSAARQVLALYRAEPIPVTQVFRPAAAQRTCPDAASARS